MTDDELKALDVPDLVTEVRRVRNLLEVEKEMNKRLEGWLADSKAANKRLRAQISAELSVAPLR